MDQQTLLTFGAMAAIVAAFTLFRRLGTISAAEAQRLVKAGARLVDVRSKAEFATVHLPGAVNIPLAELGGRGAALGPKDAPVVLYCASGSRSAMGRSLLKGQGYTRVFNLGAMSRWS